MSARDAGETSLQTLCSFSALLRTLKSNGQLLLTVHWDAKPTASSPRLPGTEFGEQTGDFWSRQFSKLPGC